MQGKQVADNTKTWGGVDNNGKQLELAGDAHGVIHSPVK
jgi:hypothetical protein